MVHGDEAATPPSNLIFNENVLQTSFESLDLDLYSEIQPNPKNAYDEEEEIISLIPNRRSFSPTSDIIAPSNIPVYPFNGSTANANVNANASVTHVIPSVPTNQNNHNGIDNILPTYIVQEEPIMVSPTEFNIFHRDKNHFFRVRKISAEERKEKVDRYLKKKQERNYSKTIRYVARKTLADSRARVKGRFAKKVKLEEGSLDKQILVCPPTKD